MCKQQGVQFQVNSLSTLSFSLSLSVSLTLAVSNSPQLTLCAIQTPNTGLLAFMSDYSDANAPTEKLSVYRFFDEEVFAFDDGERHRVPLSLPLPLSF